MSDLHSSEPGKPAARRKSLSVTLLVVVAIVLSTVVGVGSLFLSFYTVPTGSMENAVMAGDAILVDRWDQEAARGKIIVFEFPGYRDQVKPDEEQYYLKRCVALPGDTLEVRNKQVYINGVAEKSPPSDPAMNRPNDPKDYLYTFPEGALYTRDDWGPMRIPKKGDRLDLTLANLYQWKVFIEREGHAVERNGTDILLDGKPASRYIVERDYCFGMGDNRDNSLDSRYWGFIPVESISGTPRWVYWSYAPEFGPDGGSVRWDRILKSVE